MTQQALADAVGAHWITISKLERGKLPLSFEWAKRLGEALGIGEFDVFSEIVENTRIFIDGEIGKGGVANYYLDDKGKADYEAYEVPVDLATRASSNWLIIDNDDSFPYLRSGDMIQAAWVLSDKKDEFLNKLCIASIEVGNLRERINILGFPVRGIAPGTYDLNIFGGAPLRDIKLITVAVVTMALFDPPGFEERTGAPATRKRPR